MQSAIRWTVRLAGIGLGMTALLQLVLVLVFVLNPRCAPSTAPGARTFETPTKGGLVLRGETSGDPSVQPVVVYAHGYRRNRRDADPLIPDLVAAGFAVTTFDFRGSGASDGVFTTAGAMEAWDVAAVVRDLIEKRGTRPERVAIVGFSMGAVATALAAPQLPKVGAVVLIAPYASLEETIEARTRRWAHVGARPWLTPALFLCERWFGIDSKAVSPEATIGTLGETPLLLVAGAADWRAPPAVVRRMFERAGAGRAIAELPGFDHMDLERFPNALRDRVVGFLRSTMR
jgi:pimeloyl-ACP methyl ester carboxylesterase